MTRLVVVRGFTSSSPRQQHAVVAIHGSVAVVDPALEAACLTEAATEWRRNDFGTDAVDSDAYTSLEKGRHRMRLRHLVGTLEDACSAVSGTGDVLAAGSRWLSDSP